MSHVTCWYRLCDWQCQGICQQLHVALLIRLRQAGHIDWIRASLDCASVASPRGQETGRNPTYRGKLGSKRHIVLERQGIPLVVLLSGANRHDSMLFELLLDELPALAGKRGRPRCRPDKLHADKGYDFCRCRDYLRRRGIKTRIARRGIESHKRLGRHRWVVERTHGWSAGFGKLRSFERRLDIHLALLTLACAVICLRFVSGSKSKHVRALNGSLWVASLHSIKKNKRIEKQRVTFEFERKYLFMATYCLLKLITHSVITI